MKFFTFCFVVYFILFSYNKLFHCFTIWIWFIWTRFKKLPPKIIFFISLRIFYVNMATSEGGGGLQIFNCDRAIISAYLLIISAYLLIISASSFFFTHQVTGGTRYITVTFIDPWKLQNGADSSRELLLKPLGTMLPWCSKGFRRTLNCSPMMTRGTAFSGDLNL